jgi:hypothetical protein
LVTDKLPNRKCLSLLTNFFYRFGVLALIMDKQSADMKPSLTKLEKANKDQDWSECKTFVALAKKIKKNFLGDLAAFEKRLRQAETQVQDWVIEESAISAESYPEAIVKPLEGYREKVFLFDNKLKTQVKDTLVDVRVELVVFTKSLGTQN